MVDICLLFAAINFKIALSLFLTPNVTKLRAFQESEPIHLFVFLNVCDMQGRNSPVIFLQVV